jgi:hypothetical protein
VLPPGQAKRIPKGSHIALELHYTPDGTARSDRSCVGVYAAGPPRHPVLTGSALQPLLLIPPGAADYRVLAAKTLRPAGGAAQPVPAHARARQECGL